MLGLSEIERKKPGLKGNRKTVLYSWTEIGKIIHRIAWLERNRKQHSVLADLVWIGNY